MRDRVVSLESVMILLTVVQWISVMYTSGFAVPCVFSKAVLEAYLLSRQSDY